MKKQGHQPILNELGAAEPPGARAAVAATRSPPAFEPLLDSEEAAQLVGIHPKTLQKLARADVVPAHRIGKLWKFRASELDEWLRSGVCSNRHSCRN
jgi:excisionase family DNA binding protein